MVTTMVEACVLVVVVVVKVLCVAEAAEVPVPERLLRPRTFNHHPFAILAEAGIPVADQHPYNLIPRTDLHRGDDSSPVQFPKVPDVVAKPTKSKRPGYISVPKNYAFFYSVKDKNSGDDFSHTQAHNGRATQGEYRVRLPDGRVQVVSYTADKSGYRADVRYDEDKRTDDDGGNSVYSASPAADDYNDDDAGGPQANYITANIFPVGAHHNLAHSYASTTFKVTPTVSTLDVVNYTPQAYAYNTLITGRANKQHRPVYYTTTSNNNNNNRQEFDSAGYINHVATDIHSPTLPPVPPVQSTVATPIIEETDEGGNSYSDNGYSSVGPTVTPYPQYYSLPSPTPVAYVFVPRQQQYTYGQKLF